MVEKLFGVTELSIAFSVTRQTIINWIEEGRFPNAQKVSRSWAVPASDVRLVRDEELKRLELEVERLNALPLV